MKIRLNRWCLFLTSEWVLSVKLIFAVAIFNNSLLNILKSAWYSDFSKLSDSRVNIVYFRPTQHTARERFRNSRKCCNSPTSVYNYLLFQNFFQTTTKRNKFCGLQQSCGQFGPSSFLCCSGLVYLFDLCVMRVPRKKSAKTSKVLLKGWLIALDEIPSITLLIKPCLSLFIFLQLLLLSDADKSS